MHGELICNVLKKNDTSPFSVVISATTKRLHKQKENLCCSASTGGYEEIFFFLTNFWSGLKPKFAPIVWRSRWTENNCAALIK